MEKNPMRVFVLATMLLASSSLCSFAQEQGKAPAAAPQAGTPAQTDQNSQPQREQRTGRDQPKTDDREMGHGGMMRRGDSDRMGRDDHEMGRGGMMCHGDSSRRGDDDREMGRGGMMRRGDSDRMGRDDHEMGRGGMMHRDRETSRDRDPDHGRYSERGDRDRDRAERDKDNRGYSDGDRARRRVKVCFEYDNGDEYCRYRQ
ncbi:hypothetical protein KMZ29_07770 [Bradyrhizobium sediminis]|uniref:Uncharacterized protein n=1 Tax=Bradyrhizobium sediminis TaxID=2840469 RepID=A0A975RPF5_9BRAD|nr:hypothetical protein [Bradyrhizobium sediminis]QWG14551.1 hypothetical protein KMZ29_07770 [Bradyrhizobium sediminis]